MAQDTLLSVHALHTDIGHYKILQGVDLSVGASQTTVLVGRNGAGKTTTLNSVMGYRPPKQGQILFNKRDITRLRPDEVARMGVAYVPEDMAVFGDLTVLENLRLAHSGNRIPAKTIEWIGSLFPAIPKYLNTQVRFLSGGQKQMVSVSRAIVETRELIILDEPTKGLAPAIIQNMASALSELKAVGTTILLVEQNFAFARTLGDAVCVIEDGASVLQESMPIFEKDHALQERYLGLSLSEHG